MHELHPEEIEERRIRFNAIWRQRCLPVVARMPAHVQGATHDLLRKAFNAGMNYERRKNEPAQLGGMD